MTHRFRLKPPYILLFAPLWAFSFGLPTDGYSHAAGPGRVWADSLQGAADTSPQIDHLTPVQAGAGSEVTVEIDGKNFARGAYVSSSNPEVHILKTKRINDNRLETRVVIAQKATEAAQKREWQEAEARRAAEVALEKERREERKALREVVLALVQQRFPTLLRFTRQVIRGIEQTSTFQALLLQISTASTPEELHQYLLTVGEEENEE